MKKLITNNQVIPSFYGLAYWDYPKNRGVCYPLGINLAVLLWREFIHWFKCPKGKV